MCLLIKTAIEQVNKQTNLEQLMCWWCFFASSMFIFVKNWFLFVDCRAGPDPIHSHSVIENVLAACECFDANSFSMWSSYLPFHSIPNLIDDSGFFTHPTNDRKTEKIKTISNLCTS